MRTRMISFRQSKRWCRRSQRDLSASILLPATCWRRRGSTSRRWHQTLGAAPECPVPEYKDHGVCRLAGVRLVVCGLQISNIMSAFFRLRFAQPQWCGYLCAVCAQGTRSSLFISILQRAFMRTDFARHALTTWRHLLPSIFLFPSMFLFYRVRLPCRWVANVYCREPVGICQLFLLLLSTSSCENRE